MTFASARFFFAATVSLAFFTTGAGSAGTELQGAAITGSGTTAFVVGGGGGGRGMVDAGLAAGAEVLEDPVANAAPKHLR